MKKEPEVENKDLVADEAPVKALPKASWLEQLKWRVKTHKKLSLAVLALLVAVGSVIGFMQLNKSSDTASSNNSSNNQQTEEQESASSVSFEGTVDYADFMMPNFNSLVGSAKLGDASWYATSSNIIREEAGKLSVISIDKFPKGVAIMSIAASEDSIWVGYNFSDIGEFGDAGVARITDGKVTAYDFSSTNPQLYSDPFDDNKLYVLGWAGVHYYDKSTDSFVALGAENALGDARELSFSRTHIFASRMDGSDTEVSIYAYSRAAKTWSPVTIDRYDATRTDLYSSVSIIDVDGIPVAYATNASYTDCANAINEPRTAIYSFRDGKFAYEPTVSAAFAYTFANPYGLDENAIEGSATTCNEDGKYFYVKLADKDGKLTVASKQTVEYESGTSYYNHTKEIMQLQETLRLPPQTTPVQQLSDGSTLSMLVNYTVNGKIGNFAGISKDSLGTIDQVLMPENVNEFVGGGSKIAECKSGRYLVDMTTIDGGYNSAYLQSISKVGDDGKLTSLYKTTNKPAYEGVITEYDMGSTGVICKDDRIHLLGRTEFATFDILTKKLTKKAHNAIIEPNQSLLDAKNERWIFIDGASSSLRIFDTSGESVWDMKTDLKDKFMAKLVTVNDKRVVLSLTGEAEENRTVVTIDIPAKKVAKTTAMNTKLRAAGPFDDDEFVIQVGVGETKLVNIDTHEQRAVSGAFSFLPNGFTWPPVKFSSDAIFLVKDDVLWFNSDNWGLIGYKVK